MIMRRAFALAAVLLAALPAIAAPLTSPVTVTGGKIVGVQTGDVKTYLGIPFAAPPVGPLRWKAPQPVVPWQGVKEASSFSAACAQTATWIMLPKSEDCLYLNVWSPAKAAKLPVIVWIHGGGYYGGTAAQAQFNGANLAKHGAVVVTLNYRLGILGFFAHPELSAESPAGVSGGQGVHDQIAALRWVKDNIAAFGGDPGRVTIMGESAGGGSVAILIASPLAKGLFQRAIAESGNSTVNAAEASMFTREMGEAAGVAAAKATGAENLAALRAMSVEALHKQAWSPNTFVDGYLLPEDQGSNYRNRRQNDVPLLLGWNAEESTDLAPEILGTKDFTAARHQEFMQRLLGKRPSDAILATYPGKTDAEAKASMYQFINDWWGWRMVHWVGMQAKYGQSKPYAYYFAHRPAEPQGSCGYGCGAGHGAEIRFVFDNLDAEKRPWTKADRQLAARLAATWVNFARTGNPNGPGLPKWPAYNGSNASVLRIGDAAHPTTQPLPNFGLFPQLPD
jgi:para-nitrobenzyl esterase